MATPTTLARIRRARQGKTGLRHEPLHRHLCWDSRAATPGAIFVALPGHRTDGHLYLEEALARGAAGLVVAKGRLHEIPETARPFAVAAVDDTRLALAHLAADYFRHPSRKLYTIGITGTNGKTTIAHLTAHIWNEAARQQPLRPAGYGPGPVFRGGCGIIGTLGIQAGGHLYPSELTTPEAPGIQGALAEMLARGLAAAALEVSSQGIAQHRVAAVRFRLVALTQITPDHTDLHGSFEAYRQLKLGFLLKQPPGTRIVIHRDDPEAARFLPLDPYPQRTFTYGRHRGADLRIASVQLRPGGLQLELEPSPRLDASLHGAPARRPAPSPSRGAPGQGRPSAGTPWILSVPLLGRHNAGNVAAAALIALLAGIPPALIQTALRRFPGVERRMQTHRLRGRTVLDDTAMNPNSYEAALATAAQARQGAGGRCILVTAIRGNRGPSINRENALAIARWAHRIPLATTIVAGSVDVADANNQVAEGERRAFLETLEARCGPVEYHPRLQDAIARAWRESRPGDLILLLGAQGMDDGWRLLQQAAYGGAWPVGAGRRRQPWERNASSRAR